MWPFDAARDKLQHIGVGVLSKNQCYSIELSDLYKNSGCGAVRLAYTAGGRVVAGSNPVIPT